MPTPAMATTPAASPSRPSMKFTALVEMMTMKIVSVTSSDAGRTVTPNSGSDSSCTPLKAITPAASICPASFVSQSSSRMSSSTRRHTR